MLSFLNIVSVFMALIGMPLLVLSFWTQKYQSNRNKAFTMGWYTILGFVNLIKFLMQKNYVFVGMEVFLCVFQILATLFYWEIYVGEKQAGQLKKEMQ